MKILLSKGLILIFCISVSQQASAQNHADSRRFGRWLKDDPVSLVRDMGPRELLSIGTAGIGIASLVAFDESSSLSFQQNYSGSSFLGVANELGNKIVIGPASLALFGTSLLTNDTKFQDAAFTSLQSLVMTMIAVDAGKFLFARARPYQNDGPYDFDFVHPGETSFPSGHAAASFAVITPWVVYYPNVFTYTLLAIPAGTAVARVAKGKHWLSDVTAGAAIGFSMGYYLSKKHLNLAKNNIDFAPAVGTDTISLSFNVRF